MGGGGMGGRDVESPDDIPGCHFPGLDDDRFRPVSPREVAVAAGRTALVSLVCPDWLPPLVTCDACDLLWDIVPSFVFGLSLTVLSNAEPPAAPGTTMGAEPGAGAPPAVYGMVPTGVVLGLPPLAI